MSYYLVMVCPKCHKPVGDICDSCPHCGHKPKLTKEGEEYCQKKQAEAEAEAHARRRRKKRRNRAWF